MRASARTLTFALALALTGCITHGWTHDPSADFKSFRTWAWISDDPILGSQAVVSGSVVPLNPVLESWIRSAAEQTLEERGWQQAPQEEADLIATFGVGGRDTQQSSGYGYGSQVTRTRGSLSITIFDAQSKRGVWNGWATESQIAGKQMPQQKVKEIIAAVLDNFPYRNITNK